MGENERRDSDHEKQAKFVTSEKRHKKTSQKQQGKRADEKYSTDKTPLLADGRKNVVVVDRGRGQEPQLNLGIRRFKTFSGPTTRSDGDERLVDRPRGSLFIDFGMGKSGEPRLLIRFEHQIRRDRNHGEQNQQNAEQVSQRHAADEEQRQQNRHPNDHFTQVRLHQN